MEYVFGLAGLYMIFTGVILDTPNMKSDVLLRLPHFIFGPLLICYAAIQLGVIQ